MRRFGAYTDISSVPGLGRLGLGSIPVPSRTSPVTLAIGYGFLKSTPCGLGGLDASNDAAPGIAPGCCLLSVPAAWAANAACMPGVPSRISTPAIDVTGRLGGGEVYFMIRPRRMRAVCPVAISI